MIFRPVFHLALLGIVGVLGALFVFLSAKRATRRHVMDVLRRFLIVVTVIVMGAGPSIPGEAQEVTTAKFFIHHSMFLSIFVPVLFDEIYSALPRRKA